MVLGDLIVEDRGKITGQRVLDADGPKIETSMTMQGNYRGSETTEYCSWLGKEIPFSEKIVLFSFQLIGADCSCLPFLREVA